MKQLIVLCVVLGMAATTYLRAERLEQKENLLLSFRLLDERPGGGKVKVLAQSKVSTPMGSEFSPWQGTRSKSQTGGADLKSGEGISGKLTRRADGRVHLEMTFSRRTHVPRGTDSDMVRVEALEIQCFLEPGVVKRIDCSNLQTCELRLEKLE